MKHIYFSALFFCSCSSLHIFAAETAHTQRPQSQIQRPEIQKPAQSQQQLAQDFDPTPLILQNFGGMLLSFARMVSNPNDTENVLGRLSDMVNGAVNIAALGMQSTRRTNAELKQLRQQLEEELTTYFQTVEGKQFLEQWQQFFVTDNLQP